MNAATRVVRSALVAALADACLQCAAQVPFAAGGLSALDARTLFREQRETRMTFLAPEAAPVAPAWTLVLGGAYSDDGKGTRTYGVPAEVQLALDGGTTVLKLDADLYDRLETGSSTINGYGDLALTVARRVIKKGPHAVVLAAAVSVPGGSQLSSTSASQLALAAYAHHFTDSTWLQAVASATHVDGAQEGTRSIGQGGKLYLEHDYSKDRDIWLAVSRKYRRGAGGASSAAIGYDFPIVATRVGFAKSLGGTLQAGCTVSAGSRCATVEFDLVMPL